MSRDLGASLLTHYGGQVVRPIIFVELQFDAPTGTLYVHDDLGAITADDWDGSPQTWQGVGDLGGIETIEEGDDLSPYAVTLSLSGLSTDAAAAVLTDDTVLREVRILVSALAADRSLVADPAPLWRGYVDAPNVVIGSQSSISVRCESHLIALEKSHGARMNTIWQQGRHSGDLGLDFAEQMVDARLTWGGDTTRWSTGGQGAAQSAFADIRGDFR